jgi:phosphatidylserine decarboxylase
MPTPLRMALSRLTGWAADRKLPGPLRAPVYRAYARLTGADLAEARPPLRAYPSLSAFFVRRLVEGARPLCAEGLLASPVDGRVQTAEPIAGEQVLQAKGRSYAVRELLAGVGADVALDGGYCWTLYLSPRDYHRIHAPDAGRLVEARWVPGARHSVAPKVLARRMVLPVNERVALRLETARGPLLMVLVGALNVGRIRVLGVEPGHAGALEPPLAFERGAELARFEMGSTVVVVAPPGSWRGLPEVAPGAPVRLGAAIGSPAAEGGA